MFPSRVPALSAEVSWRRRPSRTLEGAGGTPGRPKKRNMAASNSERAALVAGSPPPPPSPAPPAAWRATAAGAALAGFTAAQSLLVELSKRD